MQSCLWELMRKSGNEWLPTEADETFGWRVARDQPDDPPRPTSGPPLQRLYLVDALRGEIMFNEMPAEYRPRWRARSERCNDAAAYCD